MQTVTLAVLCCCCHLTLTYSTTQLHTQATLWYLYKSINSYALSKQKLNYDSLHYGTHLLLCAAFAAQSGKITYDTQLGC